MVEDVNKKGNKKSPKKIPMRDVLIFLCFLLFLYAITCVFSGSDDSSSDVLTGQLTENQYVSAVNNWTQKLDTVGPVSEGSVVFKDNAFDTGLVDVLTDLKYITPPAKYASYNAVFKQAVNDRANGLNDMYEGKNEGDHALYNQGKALVIKSASEFKSISNQTEELTTWN